MSICRAAGRVQCLFLCCFTGVRNTRTTVRSSTCRNTVLDRCTIYYISRVRNRHVSIAETAIQSLPRIIFVRCILSHVAGITRCISLVPTMHTSHVLRSMRIAKLIAFLYATRNSADRLFLFTSAGMMRIAITVMRNQRLAVFTFTRGDVLGRLLRRTIIIIMGTTSSGFCLACVWSLIEFSCNTARGPFMHNINLSVFIVVRISVTACLSISIVRAII